jgi:Ti-type conjugative transfer relaxase TraA
MLTMRAVDENAFGAKVRDWNRTDLLEHWRAAWGAYVNERLAELGVAARIDHRSLEEQGIDLEPQHKIGPAAARMAKEGLEPDRLEEHRDIARANGDRIIANPTVALDAITRQQATFTPSDLARFAHRHSDGLQQFDAVINAVQGSPELLGLGRDGRGEERFTSREMIAVEERLHCAAKVMAEREHHRVRASCAGQALERAATQGLVLSREQHIAFAHVTDGRDLGIVVGYAGSGKSAMLAVARESWEDDGYRVRGVALSGIAAENLESGSGIASRTVASPEHHWAQGRELLDAYDVLVIDEAGMISSRQLERVLGEAERRGAKVVLVGDPEQLQAIEAGAAFRSLTERHSHVEISEVRRQHERWQQKATRELSAGHAGEALDAYRDHGMVHCAETRDRARTDLIERWTRDRAETPEQTRIILTHTNDEVFALNNLARGTLREAGELGEDVSIQVERGKRDFAAGDRVMFLKNDRGLGIKNGSLGIVETVDAGRMTVRLDAGHPVAFDFKDYAHLDHGYAATIHKAQGLTVDRAYVLATPGLARHAAYVALSRHRDSVQLHYGRDDFADLTLARVLSRDRSKDMASDYERHDAAPGRSQPELRTTSERRPAPERRNEPGIFASFRPITVSPDRQIPTMAGDPEAAPNLDQAVRRYARSILDIVRMRELELPILPHQIAAREHAGAALNALRPQATRDLDSVLDRDPALVREAAEGRTQRALRAMQVEAEIRTDPKLRADRFVKRWQEFDRQRARFAGDYNWQSERKILDSMGAMAKSLARDPQMESILQTRSRDLGIPMRMGRGIGRNLLSYLGLGRERGLGI